MAPHTTTIVITATITAITATTPTAILLKHTFDSAAKKWMEFQERRKSLGSCFFYCSAPIVPMIYTGVVWTVVRQAPGSISVRQH